MRKPSKLQSKRPDGHYRTGLWDDAYLKCVGQIATYFPLIENEMIRILGDLLGAGGGMSARQIFASINSHKARVKVMTSLLEHSYVNRMKGSEYDEFISEFDGMANSRNDYVHHIWWTHSSGRVFLAPPSVTDYGWHDGREVTLNELEGVIERMGELMRRLQVRRGERVEEWRRTLESQGTHPQQHVADSEATPPAPHTSDEGPSHQHRPSDPSPQSNDQA